MTYSTCQKKNTVWRQKHRLHPKPVQQNIRESSFPRSKLLIVNPSLWLGACNCNSMPFGAAWAYYGKVLVLVSAA